METDYYNGEKRRVFGNRHIDDHVSVEIENDMALSGSTRNSKFCRKLFHGQMRFKFAISLDIKALTNFLEVRASIFTFSSFNLHSIAIHANYHKHFI